MYSPTGYLAFQGDNYWAWGVSIDGQASAWGGAGWTSLTTNFGLGPHGNGWHDVEFFYSTSSGQNAGPVENSSTNGELLWTTDPNAANETPTWTGPYGDWHSFGDLSDPANYVGGVYILQPSATAQAAPVPTQVVLSGDNSGFSGALNVESGTTVVAASATALGTGDIPSAGGAELQTSYGSTNASLTTSGAATIDLGGAGTTFTVSGATTLGGGLTLIGDGAATLGAVTANGITLDLENTGGDELASLSTSGATTLDIANAATTLDISGAVGLGGNLTVTARGPSRWRPSTPTATRPPLKTPAA